MQSMAMMRMGVESKGQATLREAARELLLDGLSATQVTGWVVGLYGKQ
jgi:cytochrome c-type biogenesis protein CcmH/NrfF